VVVELHPGEIHDLGAAVPAFDVCEDVYIRTLLDTAEQEVVANIVRYHRKDAPTIADENFKSLPQKDRLVVSKLCAILRLADALDTSHTGRVRDALLEQRGGRWRLLPAGATELMLEKWDLEKRKSLFQEVFGVSLEIEN